jgi:acetylornithine deacetylase/succinyl-diaminopimelate desuccinylase-like protein
MDTPSLLSHPLVLRARAIARATDGDTLRDQLELVQIPAPSLAEAERGAEVARRLRLLGVEGVDVDGVGNVTGTLAHAGAEVPPLIVAAHLDTIFPADTPLQLRRRSGRWCAPGIADNTRGLAGLLALARALGGAGVRTARPVVLVASVGEEGRGDLRGVKHLFRVGSPARGAVGFIALDGCGVRRIVHRSVGSRRFRVEVDGSGGHSWADRGAANPLHALAGGIGALAAIGAATPSGSAAATRVGGGTSVNAIPQCAWAEVDLRSETASELGKLEACAREAFGAALAAENARRRAGTPPVRLSLERIGERPSGETPATEALVRAAVGATRAVGALPELIASSTDANVPMSLGIPSVAVGVGGRCGGVHTVEEWYTNTDGALGIERAVLIVLAAAGVYGGDGYAPPVTTE